MIASFVIQFQTSPVLQNRSTTDVRRPGYWEFETVSRTTPDNKQSFSKLRYTVIGSVQNTRCFYKIADALQPPDHKIQLQPVIHIAQSQDVFNHETRGFEMFNQRNKVEQQTSVAFIPKTYSLEIFVVFGESLV